jgi:thymidine phosphorylase
MSIPARRPIAEILRDKRDGQSLCDDDIATMVDGIVSGEASDAQVAAFAMAACLRGMDHEECAGLTHAMANSGDRLNWGHAGLDGPVLDKHSTGGVGDKVSLLLAPALAACGAYVPMISGRGLGHSGGTLDKLEAIPGFSADASVETLRRVVREAGCAIVSATASLAPADRRLYAIRDVTATVESIPLVTASILSKKLAAGVERLVMDVKVGNGAFTPTLKEARELAGSLVRVGTAAGLPTRALITDMNQVLGTSAGNALEVHEVAAVLRGGVCDPRLLEVTLALGSDLLTASGLAGDARDAHQQLAGSLTSGAAAGVFEMMVVGLGGPSACLHSLDTMLPRAACVRDVPSITSGVIGAMDTRAIGVAIVALGGGRRHPDDAIHHEVGFDRILGVGTYVEAGDPIARVHAQNEADAEAATAAYHRSVCLHECSSGTHPDVASRMVVVEAHTEESPVR